MLTIHVLPEVHAAIRKACQRAGQREVGGMLFAEHRAKDEFIVVEATVGKVGTLSSFLRKLTDGLSRLDSFFRRTRHDYARFNYLGEWHSHPAFTLHPSVTDDATMFQIVNDPATGARFAVSMIVKLADDRLTARGFAYFPCDVREDAIIVLAE
jgi:hypothetical protein